MNRDNHSVCPTCFGTESRTKKVERSYVHYSDEYLVMVGAKECTTCGTIYKQSKIPKKTIYNIATINNNKKVFKRVLNGEFDYEVDVLAKAVIKTFDSGGIRKLAPTKIVFDDNRTDCLIVLDDVEYDFRVYGLQGAYSIFEKLSKARNVILPREVINSAEKVTDILMTNSVLAIDEYDFLSGTLIDELKSERLLLGIFGIVPEGFGEKVPYFSEHFTDTIFFNEKRALVVAHDQYALDLYRMEYGVNANLYRVPQKYVVYIALLSVLAEQQLL